MITDLHEQRLDAALEVVVRRRAASVLDLGCGTGRLLRRLVEVESIERIVGIDSSHAALAEARQRLASTLENQPGRLTLVLGCLTQLDRSLSGFDACCLVETIEHLDPSRLSALEQSVFVWYRPRLVVITTPNAEYNELFGMAPGERRAADHRFEWDRAKFRLWSGGVAERNGYRVRFGEIGEPDAVLGAPSQMAVFQAGS